MKKLKRPICASNNPLANKCVITPNDVVKLLTQIPELKNCNVSLKDSRTGAILLIVGEHSYKITEAQQAINGGEFV